MSKNKQLGDFIVRLLRRRVKLNLRLGCLDDIVVKVTRAELREYAGTARIEDATMLAIINDIATAGYEVDGTPRSNKFVFRVRVREMLTQFDGLELLEIRNSSHAGLLANQSRNPTAVTS